MLIRRAAADDEAALASIRRSAILALAPSIVSLPEAEGWADRATAERIARAVRDHLVWVAVDESAIGWVEVADDRIAGLYVSASRAERGVGSQLLLHGEAAIRAAGYVEARLEASQNALGFYLRRGYVRAGPQLADGSHPLTKDLSAAGRTPRPPADG